MTPQRWQKVKAIFQAALERAPNERSAFLSNACGEDEALRKDVESLIASHEKDGSFIDSPAYQAAAELLTDESAELKPGKTIGSYEVVSFISRGGMGEVYLAQDKRLGRRVALKLLPSSLTKDADRLRRFEQEARAASALNHPNIITIHEIREANSTLMIATEFVEGETLRQRLAGGAMELNEALHIAIQIADALAAAHTAGIIHRDIKPENIMLRPDGYVKVLDFGLAKLIEPVSPMSIAEAPTKQVKTGSGMIMGTVGYMSPEQARGLTVDARSDIFNLGTVIYEMVSGQKPFEGETPSDVLAAILKTEPPLLSHFTQEAPAELVRIVTKTLRKDREQRYQVVKDLLLDLKSLKEDLDFQAKLDRSVAPDKIGEASAVISHSQKTATEPAPSSTSEIKTAVSTITHSLSAEIKRHKTVTLFALTAILVATIAGIFALYKLLNRNQRVAPTSAETARQVTFSAALDVFPSLSPDGNYIAYSSNQNGSFEIYVKQLTPGGREFQLTSDGQQNTEPAWSPDGQRIAFHSRRRGGIWVMPALGGSATQLTDSGSRPAWSHDGSMLAFQSHGSVEFSTSQVLPPSTLWIVSARGGTPPKQITQQGYPAGGHHSPSWSPDGKRIAFVSSNYGESSSWTVSVAGGDLKPLKGENPIYAPDGKDIYFFQRLPKRGLWRAHLSPETGEPTGEPELVMSFASAFNFTISADGKRIAYDTTRNSSSLWSLPLSPVSNEAAGEQMPFARDTSNRTHDPQFSPDGKKVAMTKWRGLMGGSPDIWMADADGKNLTPLTTNPASDMGPSWFPDGDRIAFLSDRNEKNHYTLWTITLATRREEQLLDLGEGVGLAVLSPDGKQVAFNSNKGNTTNVWLADVKNGEAKQLTFDKEFAGFPCWSRDSKWLAFETRRDDDAYLMIVPSSGGEPIPVVTDRGLSWPYGWSPDGDKIAFAGQRDGVWNLYWVSRSTKEQKQLTHYSKLNAFVRYPTWSPLGNQIIYEYNETSGNIWLIELK